MNIRWKCTELCGLFVKVKVKVKVKLELKVEVKVKLKVKVMVKVKVKFALEQTTKAQRESRGIVVLFL